MPYEEGFHMLFFEADVNMWVCSSSFYVIARIFRKGEASKPQFVVVYKPSVALSIHIRKTH